MGLGLALLPCGLSNTSMLYGHQFESNCLLLCLAKQQKMAHLWETQMKLLTLALDLA